VIVFRILCFCKQHVQQRFKNVGMNEMYVILPKSLPLYGLKKGSLIMEKSPGLDYDLQRNICLFLLVSVLYSSF